MDNTVETIRRGKDWHEREEAYVLTRKKDKYSDHLRIVLCFLPFNTHRPFVTWNENRSTTPWGYSGGHYYGTIQEAIADFEERR
jgi:hypothetical protein